MLRGSGRATTLTKRGMHIAALQLHVSDSMSDNIARAASLIDRAAEQGASLVTLPECFTGKYGVDHFAKWKEAVPTDASSAGPLGGAAMMADRARHHGIVVTGGVIEEHGGKLW